MRPRFSYLAIVFFLLFIFTGCAGVQKKITNAYIGIARYSSDLQYKTIKVEGEDVAFLERQGQGETIVLIHGFSHDKNAWLKFVKHLPEQYRVLAIDQPGHGDNILDITKSYDPYALSLGIHKTVEALGIERFHIVGNSLGGLVATVYADRHPDKIITLGLFNAGGATPPKLGEALEEMLMTESYGVFSTPTREAVDTLMDYGFYDMPFVPWPLAAVQARERIQRNDFNMRMLSELRVHETVQNPDLQNKILSQLEMPVLVLWGDKDRLIEISHVDVYKQYVKNLEIAIIKDCGHVPQLERPKESAELYIRFIAKY
jgi:abhydrolase domain-containing protein 6